MSTIAFACHSTNISLLGMATIDSLPDEIIIQIMSSTYDPPDIDDNLHSTAIISLSQLHQLYNITHICRRWRLLALSFTQFWTYVTLEFENLALLALQRCGPDVPLRVQFLPDERGYAAKKVLDALLPVIERTEYLWLDDGMQYTTIAAMVSAMEQKPMRHLKHLVALWIGYFTRYGYGDSDGGNEEAGLQALPQYVDPRNCPKLRTMQFIGDIYPILSPNCLSGLYVLHLDLHKAAHFTVMGFISALGVCDSLKELHLDLGFGAYSPESSPSGTHLSAHLPSLNDLYFITTHGIDVSRFLQNTFLPDELHNAFLRARSPSLHSAIPISCTIFTYPDDLDLSVRLDGQEVHISVVAHNGEEPASREVEIRAIEGPSLSTQTLDHIAHVCTSPNVTEFSLQLVPYLSAIFIMLRQPRNKKQTESPSPS